MLKKHLLNVGGSLSLARGDNAAVLTLAKSVSDRRVKPGYGKSLYRPPSVVGACSGLGVNSNYQGQLPRHDLIKTAYPSINYI
jgi:hypothetical protein